MIPHFIQWSHKVQYRCFLIFLKFELFCGFLKRINFDLFLYVGKYLKMRLLKFYIFICDSEQLRLESRLLLFGQIP